MNGGLHFAELAYRSELGLHREGNEDSGLAMKNLIAVADGMGGYAGGEIASKAVITSLAATLPVLNADLDQDSRDYLLRAAIVDMDYAIRIAIEMRPELDGMGTTLTALALFADQVHLLHVGDSRAYRIRAGKITRLSHDHTVVQELLDQGRITADEISDHPQRSFLTQALMGKENIEPVLHSFPVENGDIYLVCSDGLTAVVDEGRIATALRSDLVTGVSDLIEMTYHGGAPDNVTIVATRIGNTAIDSAPVLIGAAS